MPSRQAWVESSIKRGCEVRVLKVRLQNCFIKSRECFTRANISKNSKSVNDILI